MKKTVVIFILSMLAWSVVAQERDLAADARRAFEEGRYADAVELYGAVYIQDGKYYSHEKEIASQCLTKMLEAIAAVNVNQVEDAVAAYKFVLSKNPKDPVASEYVRMHEYSGYINGHEYVDLGLPSGLKWATCNVGASSPEEYGDYYAWGETKVKESYHQLNCEMFIYAAFSNRFKGFKGRDTAQVLWKSSWRMPTKTECEELRDKCTWTWSTRNGVNGYKVLGPNGCSIFLPAVGSRYRAIADGIGEIGYYWSSIYKSKSDIEAYVMRFNSMGCFVECSAFFIGCVVRPVSE